MWSVTLAKIKLISGTERPNLGIMSLKRHGYANRFSNMSSPSIPEATVPLLQTKYCGICSASARRGSSEWPNLNSDLISTIVVPVWKGWIFPVQLGKQAKHLIFIEYFIIKKHNHSCQDIFLRKHCKWKRWSWKLVVSDRCLHSKCCKPQQPATSTTLVIPGPARSNFVLVVVLGVGSKGF